MFHCIDTGFGDSSLEVFDALRSKAHQLRDAGGGTHCDLFKTKSRRETQFDAVHVLTVHFASYGFLPITSAVISSVCDSWLENASSVCQIELKVLGASTAREVRNASRRRSWPNSSLP